MTKDETLSIDQDQFWQLKTHLIIAVDGTRVVIGNLEMQLLDNFRHILYRNFNTGVTYCVCV